MQDKRTDSTFPEGVPAPRRRFPLLEPDPEPVVQTIMVGDAPPIEGNCLQAALASMLGLHLNDVPHVVALGRRWWLWGLKAFLASRGLEFTNYAAGDVEPLGRHLISGLSPRGVDHAVVGYKGVMVWDPHPTHAGLIDDGDQDWMFIHPIGEPTWKT